MRAVSLLDDDVYLGCLDYDLDRHEFEHNLGRAAFADDLQQ